MEMVDEPAERADFRKALRAFVTREVPSERAREADRDLEPLLPEYRKVGANGWLSVGAPEDLGGSGDFIDVVTMLEELSYGSYPLASQVGRTVAYAVPVLTEWGSPAARERYLPGLLAGKTMLSLAMTEPDTGSDAGGITTRAEVSSDKLRVSGEKIYSSGGMFADVFLVTVRTDPASEGKQGVSVVLVDADTPGVSRSVIPAMGMRSNAFASVRFDDVVVSRDMLLGELNDGWPVLTGHLERERINIAAKCLGAMRSVLDTAARHSTDRVQFGRTLAKMPVIRHKFADMAMDLYTARLATYRAAGLYARGLPCRAEAFMCKVHATEAYHRMADHGLQIMGALGYTTEANMERHFRDSRSGRIGGGTSEILRTSIGAMVAAGAWNGD